MEVARTVLVLVRLCGLCDYVNNGKRESPLQLVGQIQPEPPRDPQREGGNDDGVVVLGVLPHLLLDGEERRIGADNGSYDFQPARFELGASSFGCATRYRYTFPFCPR